MIAKRDKITICPDYLPIEWHIEAALQHLQDLIFP